MCKTGELISSLQNIQIPIQKSWICRRFLFIKSLVDIDSHIDSQLLGYVGSQVKPVPVRVKLLLKYSYLSLKKFRQGPAKILTTNRHQFCSENMDRSNLIQRQLSVSFGVSKKQNSKHSFSWFTLI